MAGPFVVCDRTPGRVRPGHDVSVGSLFSGAGFVLLFTAAYVLGRPRLLRRADDATGQDAIDLRRAHEASWPSVFLGVWSGLSLVLAIALLVEGSVVIGLGWLVIAGLWAVAVAYWRRTSRVVLDRLGERGHSPRPARFVARAAVANRFGAVGAAGYVLARAVRLAFPDATGVALNSVLVAGTVALVVGLSGFAGIRCWMWWKGDDLAA